MQQDYPSVVSLAPAIALCRTENVMQLFKTTTLLAALLAARCKCSRAARAYA
jgi:hypothetical protein